VRDVSVEATPQPAASAANQQVMLAVHLQVRPDARESMRQALTELVDATRRHDRGVVRFEVGLDPEDDTRVFGYEIWESQQALEEHADCVTGDSGPLVVLLHGFPNTWYAWRQVMAQLARTHSVLAVDLRGLGDSDANAHHARRPLAIPVLGVGGERVFGRPSPTTCPTLRRTSSRP
jgi:quinol monooxygenase YgiN